MKIAIIDDGIYYAGKLNKSHISHFAIQKGIVTELYDCDETRVTHGAICGYILNNIIQGIEIIDIKIFEQNKASIDDLLCAMQWCSGQNISIINMSFGTLNYFDGKRLNKAIQSLIHKGIYIVAAHNNLNLISYPASCKGVFGVRSDNSNMLKRGEYGYKACDYLYPENCFVAYDKVDSFYGIPMNGNGYSFAAPVITGHIAKILWEEPNLKLEDIYKKLMNGISQQVMRADNILKKSSEIKKNIEVPIIAFTIEHYSIWKELRNKFYENGYLEESFCEMALDKKVIPIDLYVSENEKLSKDFISTISYIYDADVFLLCINKERLKVKKIWEVVDVVVEYNKREYCIYSEECKFKCGTVSEVYGCIVDLLIEQ